MKPHSLLFALFLCCAIISCKGPTDQQGSSLYEQRDGKVIYHGDKPNTVTVHILSDPSSLHPINSELAIRYEILDLGFERLMSFDIHGDGLVPQIAEAPPTVSEDGLTYRYKIRDEAAWSDGTPILAEDIVFSTKLILCPLIENKNLKPYLEYISDIQVDESDPKTVIVRMKSFYLNNDYFGVYTYVMDARFYDPKGVLSRFSVSELLDPDGPATNDKEMIAWADKFNGQEFGREVNYLNQGSGPYTMTEWVPEQRIVLSRNENYWGKNGSEDWQSQGPDEIIFKIVRADNAVELQVKEQLIDVSTYLQPSVFENLQNDPSVEEHFQLTIEPRTSFTSIALNNRPDGITHQRFFDDATVRKALSLAIDRERFIQDALNGMGSISNSPVPPSNPHYHKGLDTPTYDPEQAEQLLAQAGWIDSNEDGVRDKMIDGKRVEFSFSFLYPPGSSTVDQMAQFVISELARVGIECKPGPSAEYAQKVQNKDFDASLLSLRASSLPYDFKQTFHSTNWPNGTNYFGYSNERADILMDELRGEKKEDRRKEIANEIQEIILDDQPVIFLFYPVKRVLLHRRYSDGTIYQFPPYVLINQLEVVRE